MSGSRRPLDAVSARNLRTTAPESLRDAIARLPGAEGPQAPPEPLPAAWVYFVQSGTGGPIKIGYARDPYTRFLNLRTASPAEVVYLGHVPGGRDEERAIHDRFSSLRIRGEWFRPDPELLDFIDENRFDVGTV